MDSIKSGFEIDDNWFTWGRTLEEVRAAMGDVKQFKPYGGWPNLRFRCASIFGLAALEANVRAPFEDRPVMQVQYEIAPIKHEWLQRQHTPYLKVLENVLGKADKTEHHEGKGSGSLVYTAEWWFGDVRVGLSLFGGIRKEISGASAAGLFINWYDEITAATPFRPARAALEAGLTNHLNDSIVVHRFRLDYKQRGYSMVHYELKDPHIAMKQAELRAAQLALYSRTLLQTPDISLQEDEVAVYFIPALNKTFVSNRWDTIDLSMPGELELLEVMPARGPGYRTLDLRGLKIQDSRSSDVLLQLQEYIEGHTPFSIITTEGLDD